MQILEKVMLVVAYVNMNLTRLFLAAFTSLLIHVFIQVINWAVSENQILPF